MAGYNSFMMAALGYTNAEGNYFELG